MMTSFNESKPALYDYAFVATSPSEEEKPTMENTLLQLKNLAMNENWAYSKTENAKPFPILFNYLLHTFAKIKEQNKISENGAFSAFNTGLATENQEEIFMVFKKNQYNKRRFIGFFKESAWEMNGYSPLPDRATYFNDPSELMYDTRLELRINIDHIVNDSENFARFPQHIKDLPLHQLINTFRGAVDHAKKRIRRNYLTAIPQYYRGKYFPDGQLQLLLPLCLTDPTKADLALAVFRNGNTYNGRTCLTLDMAINNARLITKPDDEWLKP